MRRRLLTIGGVALLAIGCMQTAKGGVQPLKAWIGQRMLTSAWEESRDAGAPAKPWGWADVAVTARLEVPRLDTSAVVLSDASGEAMAWGPGHVPGTAALGAPGLAAIAGHRDSHLAFLADLAPGDRLTLETLDGQRLEYRVDRALVVDSRAWHLRVSREGAPRLALVTCWPFDSAFEGPLRFVLYAEPV